MELYVGNLSYSCTDADLQALFEPHGVVESARIATDRMSGQSKGFGFVQMPNPEQGTRAIEILEGQAFMGRPLRVTESKPKPRVERPKPDNFGQGRGGYARY